MGPMRKGTKMANSPLLVNPGKLIKKPRNLTQGPYQGYWSQGNSDLDDVTPLFSRLNAAWRDKFREKYYYKKNFEFQETLADLKPLVDRAE